MSEADDLEVGEEYSEEVGEEETATLGDGESESESESAEELEAAKKAAEAEERRRAYRLNKVLGATLTSGSGEAEKARLFIIDISLTGFRATDHKPHNESEYEISIILIKDQEPFQSKMRVVWTKELTVSGMFQMGCEFVDASPENLQRLQAFIDAEQGRTTEATKPTFEFGYPWTMIR